MTFGIDNPEGGLQQPPLRKICLGKTLRRTRVKLCSVFLVPRCEGVCGGLMSAAVAPQRRLEYPIGQICRAL